MSFIIQVEVASLNAAMIGDLKLPLGAFDAYRVELNNMQGKIIKNNHYEILLHKAHCRARVTHVVNGVAKSVETCTCKNAEEAYKKFSLSNMDRKK